MIALAAAAIIAYRHSAKNFLNILRRATIVAAAKKNPIVTMSQLTDFEWDKLLIFGPYTSSEGVNSQLGFNWPEAQKTGIDVSETIFLLVFVKDQCVVRYFLFPRTIGEFESLDKNNVFPHGKDIFMVRWQRVGDENRLIFSEKE